MKCDELQERWFEAYAVEGDQIIPTKVYGKKDADDAIAELKCELKDVTDDRNEFKQLYIEHTEKLCIEKTNVDTLEHALNQMQRTLWLARAERAHSIILLWNVYCYNNNSLYYRDFLNVKCNPFRSLPTKTAMEWSDLWESIETKCRAKAKEFV